MVMMMREEKKVDYDLDMRIFQLLQDEPFFALLSRQLNKVPNPNIGTAGILFNKEDACYEVHYNPEFMAGKREGCPMNGLVHEKWVLMHELYHASLGHCTYRKQEGVSHDIQNKGMDLAINSLPNLASNAPDWVLMPGRAQFESIPEREQASEWYINRIKKEEEEQPGKHTGEGGGEGQFDSHEGFGGDQDIDCPEKQVAARRLADAIAKAANECDVGDGDGGQPKGWGTVSAETNRSIKKFSNSQKAKLDPKKVLGSFIKASVAADKKTSVTKRNRRLPGRKFGRKVSHRAHIAFSIDQSGSVSDELLAKVFDWLGEFAKHATFTVVPFDNRVFEKKVYEWKKGEKRPSERVLHGGTNFDAPTEYVNKRQFDGHVIITDMYAPKPKRSNCQRMWITDKNGAGHKAPAGSETVLVLD